MERPGTEGLHVASAYFVFVAVDAKGGSRQVPPLRTETAETSAAGARPRSAARTDSLARPRSTPGGTPGGEEQVAGAVRRVGARVARVTGDTDRVLTSPSADEERPVSTPARFTTAERAARVRFRRALCLMVMTLVVPGSAQLVAGNRRVGRIAFRIWLGLLRRAWARSSPRSSTTAWSSGLPSTPGCCSWSGSA